MTCGVLSATQPTCPYHDHLTPATLDVSAARPYDRMTEMCARALAPRARAARVAHHGESHRGRVAAPAAPYYARAAAPRVTQATHTPIGPSPHRSLTRARHLCWRRWAAPEAARARLCPPRPTHVEPFALCRTTSARQRLRAAARCCALLRAAAPAGPQMPPAQVVYVRARQCAKRRLTNRSQPTWSRPPS